MTIPTRLERARAKLLQAERALNDYMHSEMEDAKQYRELLAFVRLSRDELLHELSMFSRSKHSNASVE